VLPCCWNTTQNPGQKHCKGSITRMLQCLTKRCWQLNTCNSAAVHTLQAAAAAAYMLLALYQPWRYMWGQQLLDTSACTVTIIIPVSAVVTQSSGAPA
jgi:hypothetical protein